MIVDALLWCIPKIRWMYMTTQVKACYLNWIIRIIVIIFNLTRILWAPNVPNNSHIESWSMSWPVQLKQMAATANQLQQNVSAWMHGLGGVVKFVLSWISIGHWNVYIHLIHVNYELHWALKQTYYIKHHLSLLVCKRPQQQTSTNKQYRSALVLYKADVVIFFWKSLHLQSVRLN